MADFAGRSRTALEFSAPNWFELSVLLTASGRCTCASLHGKPALASLPSVRMSWRSGARGTEWKRIRMSRYSRRSLCEPWNSAGCNLPSVTEKPRPPSHKWQLPLSHKLPASMNPSLSLSAVQVNQSRSPGPAFRRMLSSHSFHLLKMLFCFSPGGFKGNRLHYWK